MNYQVSVSGSVYSIDPVRNVDAYASAVFTDLAVVDYRLNDEDSHLVDFIIRRRQFVNGDATIADLTDGLFAGDDTNITYELKVERNR